LTDASTYTLPQARKSTLVVAAVTAALGAWQIYRGRPNLAEAFGAASVALIVCAMIPAGAMWFNKWWMNLARGLGYVNSRIVLSLLYYVVITPTGILTRMLGHDPLERRKGHEPSYWRKRARTRQLRQEYERAF